MGATNRVFCLCEWEWHSGAYGTLAPVPPHFLQITCLQLDDPVQCRVHWPMYCDLRINTMQYNATGRSSSTKLGANQRDEPANITALCHGCKQWVGRALCD